jgi:hypothetical protein
MVGATTSVCQHHWLLSEPHQDVVHGTCIRCGAQRDYPARPEGSERYDDYEELARPSLQVRLTTLTDEGWGTE